MTFSKPPEELDDYDLFESEAAAMTDREILGQFERRERDAVWAVLAEDIAERFEMELEDDD